MGQITETSTFDSTVYQWETTDSVTGGPNGIANVPLKNLANRTRFLKDRQDLLLTQVATLAPTNSPTLTGSPTAPTPLMSAKSNELATAGLARNFASGLIGIAMTSTYSTSPIEAAFASMILTGGLQGPALLLMPTNTVGKWTILNGTNVPVSVRLSQGGQAITIAAQTAQTIIANGTDCFNGHNDYTSIYMGGTPTTPTPTLDDNSNRVTNTAWVVAKIGQEAATRAMADAQIRSDVGAAYALQSALNGEAAARSAADTQEVQDRLQGDLYEANNRYNADNQIRVDVDNAYVKKGQTQGGSGHVNFTPGDYFDVPTAVNLTTGSMGGTVFVTSSLTLTYQIPNTVTLDVYVGAAHTNNENTFLPMAVQTAVYVPPNTTITISAHARTSSGGGWCQMAIALAYVFIPNG